jgi:DNA-binding IclR family transcriptional regulator
MSLRESYYVPRVMQTLEYLSNGPRRAGEIAEHLKVNDRTARRMLLRLADEGYISRPGIKRAYSLTPRFSALAERALGEATVGERQPRGRSWNGGWSSVTRTSA